jgi:hypothetical protein
VAVLAYLKMQTSMTVFGTALNQAAIAPPLAGLPFASATLVLPGSLRMKSTFYIYCTTLRHGYYFLRNLDKPFD